MTRMPGRIGLITMLAVGTALAVAAPAAAVVIDPFPPNIAFLQANCRDDAVPDTAVVSIGITNPSDDDGSTRTYAWSLSGPGGTTSGAVVVADGEYGTVNFSGLLAGAYVFEAFDAADASLAISTGFDIEQCPPPATTTTTTTTPPSTTTTTTTTTTDPQITTTTDPDVTTTIGPTTSIVNTTPPPGIDPDSPPTLPATGSSPTELILLGGAAVCSGWVIVVLGQRRRATR